MSSSKLRSHYKIN